MKLTHAEKDEIISDLEGELALIKSLPLENLHGILTRFYTVLRMENMLLGDLLDCPFFREGHLSFMEEE